MGTGIGKYCERCCEQLNYDDGFVEKEYGAEYDLCRKCANIVAFDKDIKANN